MICSILLLAAFMGFQKSMEIPTDEEITTVRIVAVDEEGRPNELDLRP